VLNRAVERRGWRPAGTILIDDPRTGEILAMAKYPMFDPDSLTRRTCSARATPL